MITGYTSSKRRPPVLVTKHNYVLLNYIQTGLEYKSIYLSESWVKQTIIKITSTKSSINKTCKKRGWMWGISTKLNKLWHAVPAETYIPKRISRRPAAGAGHLPPVDQTGSLPITPLLRIHTARLGIT